MNLSESLRTVKTPSYIIDEQKLIDNLTILQRVERESGAHILLAQKCFSAYKLYPLIKQYISGCTASGLFEARLGYEEMGGENHVFSPAYSESDFNTIVKICDHVSFNSFSQWEKYKDIALSAGVSCGIRINPEHSTQKCHEIYDPCAPGSRLGVTRENFRSDLLDGIEGLHFHTLCEQNADALAETAEAVEEKFGEFLPRMKWVNMGGGHHITREDYDIPLLIKTVKHFNEKYGVTVYLEPGEAVALNAGYLISSVMETLENNGNIAILDASAACHMPDVLEMPYRPYVIDGGEPGEKPFTYTFAGNTCLAGDIIGKYSFDNPLSVGDKVIFTDMAIYSMVKNNTFNGMPLPSIKLLKWDESIETLNEFGYKDFKERL